MPVFMDDPSVLTKERLKSELLANNVELPGGNPPKDVYVQLYVKTLSAQSHSTDAALDAFSSDEELPPPVLSRRSRSSGRKSEARVEKQEQDVALLTDQALREQLLAHGVHAGPIVASTRKLYKNKLQKLLDKRAVASEPQKNHNGSGDAEVYSDQEEELTAVPDPEPKPAPEPVPEQKEGVRSRRNNTSRHSQHSAVTRPVERRAEGAKLTCRSKRLSYRVVPEALGPLSTERESQKRSHSPVRGSPPPSSRHASAPSTKPVSAPVATATSTRPALAHVSSSSPAPAPGSVAPISSSRPSQVPATTGCSISPAPALAPVVPVSSSRSTRVALVPVSSSRLAPAPGSVPLGSYTRPSLTLVPVAPSSSRPAQAPLDPLTFISRCNISPIKRPTESKQERVSSAATEKVQKVEQMEQVEQVEKIRTEPPPEEDLAVPELNLTGLTATCRRPIKGAGGRPVIPANHSQSAHAEIKVSSPALLGLSSAPSLTSTAKTTHLSGHSICSGATPFSPNASAPSARQAKARGGMSWWKKLLLWAVLAGFLFLVYQAMETNTASPFEEIKE